LPVIEKYQEELVMYQKGKRVLNRILAACMGLLMALFILTAA
jgi:hypothetical protein